MHNFARMNQRQIFFSHIAQTSPAPPGLEIIKAEGIYQYDVSGKKYIDLIAGFSVANIGHSHPKVVQAIKDQAEKYLHLIVYGEFIESPQTAYAKLLTDHLPPQLSCVYFTNSGAEATEGAMKLAKRITGRNNIISFNKSYHGSTQGALSIMGDEYWRQAYRPLLPGIVHADFGSDKALHYIDDNTACVIMEVVQAESGNNQTRADWLQAIRKRCTEKNALLIFDEIQSGFGRTGSLWAFEQFNVVPDVLLLGKAAGGGMPLGAFISSKQNMDAFTHNPVLGHITTFGGHPVSCAAGKAAFEILLEDALINDIRRKENILKERLQHREIKKLNTCGLWASVHFNSFETCRTVVHNCIDGGLITDWLLFAPQCLRIAPPLSITAAELHRACDILLESIDKLSA